MKRIVKQETKRIATRRGIIVGMTEATTEKRTFTIQNLI